VGGGVLSILFYPTFQFFLKLFTTIPHSTPIFQTLVILQPFFFNPLLLLPHLLYTPSNRFETLYDAGSDLSECGKGYVLGGGCFEGVFAGAVVVVWVWVLG
jgi:hypothetical protein